jgi:hypothetical protein
MSTVEKNGRTCHLPHGELNEVGGITGEIITGYVQGRTR